MGAKLIGVVAMLGLLAGGCRTAKPGATPEARVNRDPDYFPWQEKGPLEFLDLLRERGRMPGDFSCIFSLREQHVGFVKETDLAALIALLDSTEPCAHVRAGGSSTLAFGQKSFVGQEALVLIQGYRVGHYPPFEILSNSNSLGWYKSKDKVLAWWRERARRQTGASS